MKKLIDRITEFRLSLFGMAAAKGFYNLYDVGRFRQAIERERARADRWDQRLSMLSLGVKRSKAGEETLKLIARRLKNRLRNTDEAGWLDYRHIGVLMPNTEAIGAWTLADEVCSSLPHDIELPECRVFAYPSEWFAGDGHNAATGDGSLSHNGLGSNGLGSNGLDPYGMDAGDDNDSQTEAMEPLFFQRLPVWKRALDVFGAAFGLAVISPILFVVAALVRMTSPGPIFFSQVRLGLGGRPFRIYKFRTMVVDAEAKKELLASMNEHDGPVFKIKNDPRITGIGRILRSTSLDELPQLWNVLRGDMTLVGPRPPLAKEVAQYEPWQRRRLDVTPGLTCIWQVEGRSRVTFLEWMRMDVRYIRKRSMFLDFKLLVKTVLVVVMRRGH
jgi:lipopolysaccharide/colanic/teichoic acid biosynthesis glycosyltransferase